MPNVHRLARVVLSITALATSVAACHAHAPPRHVAFNRGGGPQQIPTDVHAGETLDADDSFAVVSGGCRYTATLTGRVEQTRYGSAGEPFGARTYSPTVTVDARAQCDAGSATGESVSTLASEGMSREQLLRDLAGTGIVSVRIEGRPCTLRPRFTIDSSSVRVTGVDVGCSEAE